MTVSDPTPAAAEPEETTEVRAPAADRAPDEVVEDDVLVEEISIDGMCGVY